MTNRYITNGAGVSVPSESLGFYFSGMRTASSGNISYEVDPVTFSDAPTQLVNSLLKVDTSVYEASAWYNISLPDNVKARAEASLTWVPTGPKGILVVIGGVPNPVDVTSPSVFGCTPVGNNATTQITQTNNVQGSSFMGNVSIYDVASGRWYVQATSGTPPPVSAQACAVVASSQDNKTHNIYLYGGYDGTKPSAPSDDVWILSLPSFTWVKALAGTSNHGRYAHVCAKPYADQMLIVGGTRDCGNELSTTLIADVFNLNTLKWQGSYDPLKYSDYVTPSIVSDAIKATPTANMDAGLLALFQTSYPSSIPRYYPYARADTTVPSDSGKPSWIIPVAVAVPIISVVLIILVACFCYRRRKGKSSNGSHNRISTWIHGQSHPAKSDRSEDETTQVDSPGMAEAFGDTYFKPIGRTNVAELNDNSNHSLTSAATSPYASPHSHHNAGRSVLSAELQADNGPLYELPAETPRSAPFKTPVIKNHPMYPPSLGDHVSSVGETRSISSPGSDPMTPCELSENKGRESMLLPPPNDMVLNQSSSSLHPSQVSSSGAKTPHRAITSASTTSISPELNPVNISPELPPANSTSRAASGARSNRPAHQRNISSISSNLEDLTMVSPREETRRSNAIAALPEYPQNGQRHSGHIDGIVSPATTSAHSPVDQTGLNGVVSPTSTNTSPVRPQSGGFPNIEVRRRDVQQWPRHREPSAYNENKGDTV